MRAPHHERRAMLDVAIHRATEELNAPIDRVEVVAGHVLCWAGSKMVTLLYDYAQGGSHDDSGRFIPHVGTGWWRVEVVPNSTLRRPSLIGRALAKLTKRKTE
ncbi:MAG: hypothetical protein P4L76_08440 [Beijerinckiaceae bacterium]|nr:hypothetical protein [Beijerinckiaceae bacterium]